MFTSIKDLPIDRQNEKVPQSSPPWVWVGFMFAGVCLTREVASLFIPLYERRLDLGLQLITLAAWIYWMVCLYRIHKIMNELSRNRYPYSPGEVVGKHFIPFYNVYWIFRWPSELANYINDRGRVRMISGNVIGTMILFGMFLRGLDAGIGFTALFGVLMYISNIITRHVEVLQGVSPDLLPPLPDPKIFSKPIQSSTVMAQEVHEGSESVKPL